MGWEQSRGRRVLMRGQRRVVVFCAFLVLLAALFPAAPSRPVAAAGADEAVSYRVDPAHTGSQPGETLRVPLVRRWSVDLGGSVSYPLVAAGRVFVTVADAPTNGSRLYALDASTGRTVWGPIELGGVYSVSAAAYESGRIFAVNFDGLIRAFDAVTGAVVWSTALHDDVDSPPTAFGGILYVGSYGAGGLLRAISEATGTMLWAQRVAYGMWSAPTVSASAVYVTYAGQQDFAFDRLTGARLWHHALYSGGGGGATSALHGGLLYDLDEGGSFVSGGTIQFIGPVVLDALTGTGVASFTANRPPAFDGPLGFFLSGGVLRAVLLPTQTTVWSSGVTGAPLDGPPVVAGGVVYVTDSAGTLDALDETTGTTLWSQNLGTPTPCCANRFVSSAVGEGMLVAPMGDRLTAFVGGPPG